MVTVHRLNFVDWQPGGITAIDGSDKWLAVLRDDGTLGIHTLGAQNFPLLYAVPLSFSVECMCFLGSDRLMLAGSDGRVREWSVPSKKLMRQVVIGQPVWSMCALNQKEVALGCEDGSVRILRNLAVDRVLKSPRSERIVSLSARGDRIAAGTAAGHLLLHGQASLESVQLPSEAIVWSVAWLSSTELVTGDSLGRLCWWSLAAGALTLLRQVKSHEADILCLQVTPNSTLMASGVDASLVEFDGEGVQIGKHRHHTHDVRGMRWINGALVTGSLDTNLIVHREKSVRLPAPMPQGTVKMAGQLMAALCRPDCLRVWSLAEGQERLLFELKMQQAAISSWDVWMGEQGECRVALLDASGHLRLYLGAEGGMRKLDCDLQAKLIKWTPRGLALLDSEGICIYTSDLKKVAHLSLQIKGPRFAVEGNGILAIAGMEEVAQVQLETGSITRQSGVATAVCFKNDTVVWSDSNGGLHGVNAQLDTAATALLSVDNKLVALSPSKYLASLGSEIVYHREYRHALAMCEAEGNLILIERTKAQMEASLPPVLKRARYGRK